MDTFEGYICQASADDWTGLDLSGVQAKMARFSKMPKPLKDIYCPDIGALRNELLSAGRLVEELVPAPCSGFAFEVRLHERPYLGEMDFAPGFYRHGEMAVYISPGNSRRMCKPKSRVGSGLTKLVMRPPNRAERRGRE